MEEGEGREWGKGGGRERMEEVRREAKTIVNNPVIIQIFNRMVSGKR
ncbi:hypothetical protein V5735_18810 (plasmid) [Haladaptatus sp. SPP-AMP-3]